MTFSPSDLQEQEWALQAALPPYLCVPGLGAAARGSGSAQARGTDGELGAAGSCLLSGAQADVVPTQQPTLQPVLRLDRDERTGKCCQLKKAGPAPAPPPFLVSPAQPSSKIAPGVTVQDSVSPSVPRRQRAGGQGQEDAYVLPL